MEGGGETSAPTGLWGSPDVDDVNNPTITTSAITKCDADTLFQIKVPGWRRNFESKRWEGPEKVTTSRSPTYLDHGEEGWVRGGLLGDGGLLGCGGGSHCIESGLVLGG
jgi:hypothetical protein